jgi:hypothetical protein
MPYLSKLVLASLTFAVLWLGAPSVAHADTITFVGSRDTVNGPRAAPDIGRCGAAPPNALVILSGTGTSNVGSFTATDSHCLNGAPGEVFNGLFAWDFGGGNTFFGTFLGTLAPLPTPPPNLAFSETFTLTGGTGLFAGASGSFLGTGTITFNPNGTANSHTDFTGTINTVPEPTTMLLLGTGLAGVGAAVRKRRKAHTNEEA